MMNIWMPYKTLRNSYGLGRLYLTQRHSSKLYVNIGNLQIKMYYGGQGLFKKLMKLWNKAEKEIFRIKVETYWDNIKVRMTS